MANAITLELAPRELLGKKVKQLRRQGYTPVHLYGKGAESRSLQGETKQLLRALAKGQGGDPIEVSVAGEKAKVTAKVGEIQWDPRSDQLLHVDLILA